MKLSGIQLVFVLMFLSQNSLEGLSFKGKCYLALCGLVQEYPQIGFHLCVWNACESPKTQCCQAVEAFYPLFLASPHASQI